jgi:hypothetical protein
MSKIMFKPAGAANTHSVFKDGKLVGEFRFIREKVITRPDPRGERIGNFATAGHFSDFESNGEYDLGCFAFFKDVKRHLEAHYTSKAARLRPDAYRRGQELFREGDTVCLNARTGSKDRRPVKIERLYSDIDGGVRLEEVRGDFVSWNVCDLDKVAA